jgi:hypothetical protein
MTPQMRGLNILESAYSLGDQVPPKIYYHADNLIAVSPPAATNPNILFLHNSFQKSGTLKASLK